MSKQQSELRSEIHSLVIQAIVLEDSIDKSDIMIYPRKQQEVYSQITDKIMSRVEAQLAEREPKIRENELARFHLGSDDLSDFDKRRLGERIEELRELSITPRESSES